MGPISFIYLENKSTTNVKTYIQIHYLSKWIMDLYWCTHSFF